MKRLPSSPAPFTAPFFTVTRRRVSLVEDRLDSHEPLSTTTSKRSTPPRPALEPMTRSPASLPKMESSGRQGLASSHCTRPTLSSSTLVWISGQVVCTSSLNVAEVELVGGRPLEAIQLPPSRDP